MQKGFVFLDEVMSGLRWDAKYATWDNFTGRPVDGYKVNRVVASREMATALKNAKELAKKYGYGLLVWDAYRPQCAVDDFVKWTQMPENGACKEKFYPNISRKAMIDGGYIAKHSSHSRGSAIDLTLYHSSTNALIKMGGGFDLMDERSHHGTHVITPDEARNRLILRSIMEAGGFEAYENEWWHYVLQSEPYPNTYFNFPVI